MLSVSDLHVSYGAIQAVRDVSLTVAAGETVALLGPNGAGKTSTISAIVGLIPARGRIVFDGADISSLSTEDRIRRRMSVTPEGRHVFANLTVAENLRLGGTLLPRHEAENELDRVLALFPRLRERARQMSGTLSGGEQQMLALARSLMSRPQLLLLDEPSLGLAPRIIEEIFDYIAVLKEQALTLLIVEQNVTQALKAADRAYVMASGRLRLEGRAEDLAAESTLVATYLGG